jgi:hypothetical protein
MLIDKVAFIIKEISRYVRHFRILNMYTIYIILKEYKF